MSNIFERRLVSVGVYAFLGRDTCVPRSGYMRTSVGIRVYLGRGTCVPRSQGRRIKLNFPSTAYLSSPHSIPLSVVLG